MVTELPATWLERYSSPLPIRSRGAFHLLSTVRAADATPCVVVVPGPGTEPGRAARAFAEMERVHRLLDHPIIPAVAACGEALGTPYLELRCDAVMDGVEAHGILTDTRRRVPLAAAEGFITILWQAMRASHAVTDPARLRPVCLGSLSCANVLFARSGRFYLVGYGHNFPFEPDSEHEAAWTRTFEAPEVSSGEEPSAAGDYVALRLLARSLLPLVDLGPTIARLLDRRMGNVLPALIEDLRWADRHLIGLPASLRSSVEEAEAMAERIRVLCGVTPDAGAFISYMKGIIDIPELPGEGEGGENGQQTIATQGLNARPEPPVLKKI